MDVVVDSEWQCYMNEYAWGVRWPAADGAKDSVWRWPPHRSPHYTIAAGVTSVQVCLVRTRAQPTPTHGGFYTFSHVSFLPIPSRTDHRSPILDDVNAKVRVCLPAAPLSRPLVPCLFFHLSLPPISGGRSWLAGCGKGRESCLIYRFTVRSPPPFNPSMDLFATIFTFSGVGYWSSRQQAAAFTLAPIKSEHIFYVHSALVTPLRRI